MPSSLFSQHRRRCLHSVDAAVFTAAVAGRTALSSAMSSRRRRGCLHSIVVAVFTASSGLSSQRRRRYSCTTPLTSLSSQRC
eukprot:3484088-Pleurochrysis_carterae.AAC.1